MGRHSRYLYCHGIVPSAGTDEAGRPVYCSTHSGQSANLSKPFGFASRSAAGRVLDSLLHQSPKRK